MCMCGVCGVYVRWLVGGGMLCLLGRNVCVQVLGDVVNKFLGALVGPAAPAKSRVPCPLAIDCGYLNRDYGRYAACPTIMLQNWRAVNCAATCHVAPATTTTTAITTTTTTTTYNHFSENCRSECYTHTGELRCAMFCDYERTLPRGAWAATTA